MTTRNFDMLRLGVGLAHLVRGGRAPAVHPQFPRPDCLDAPVC